MRIEPWTTCTSRLSMASASTASLTRTMLAVSGGGSDSRYTERRRKSITQERRADDGTSNTTMLAEGYARAQAGSQSKYEQKYSWGWYKYEYSYGYDRVWNYDPLSTSYYYEYTLTGTYGVSYYTYIYRYNSSYYPIYSYYGQYDSTRGSYTTFQVTPPVDGANQGPQKCEDQNSYGTPADDCDGYQRCGR